MAANPNYSGDFRAIPTTYNGILYRSRLEARVAVMLTTLGQRFSYEEEGYETPYGRYLPDFWLPDAYAGGLIGVLLEVKPEGWDEDRTVAFTERTALDDEGLLEETVWQTNTETRLQYVAIQLGVGGVLVRGIDPAVSEWVQVAPAWAAPVGLYACVHCGTLTFGGEVTRCARCRQADAATSAVRLAWALGQGRGYRFWKG